MGSFHEGTPGNAEIARGRWRIEPEGDDAPAGQRHGRGGGIVAIEQLDSLALEDARLGGAVVGKAGVKRASRTSPASAARCGGARRVSATRTRAPRRSA